MTRDRRGVTLVEAVLALALGALVLTAVVRLLVVHLGTVQDLALRMEAEEASRLTFDLLHGEVRTGVPRWDWGPATGEAVSVRSFRGTARACGVGSEAGEVVVRYRGVGAVRPDRDSVLVLPHEGTWTASAVRGVEGVDDGCSEGFGTGGGTMWEAAEGRAREEVWRLDPPVGGPLLLLSFRREEYHLADAAFRLLVGDAGRQPLTPERFGDGSVVADDGGRLRLVVELVGAVWGEPRRSYLIRSLPHGSAGGAEP